jgi:alkaline phosphatase D
MTPSYPALSLPNLYTLATGLYPEHHGIVAGNFYDPARKQYYSNRDPAASGDGSWYGGVPLWVLAEKQGMRSACFLWPGCQAQIDGARPSYYLKQDNRSSGEKRVAQVIAWLRLPPQERPHFIALYYPVVEQAGDASESSQTADAVQTADKMIGVLWAEMEHLKLPIDLIVVSGNGVSGNGTAREQGSWIDLDKYADLSNFITVGPLLCPNSEAAAEKAYQQLKIVSDAFTVYRRKRVPAGLNYNASSREGDPIVVPNGPYAARAHAPRNGGADKPPRSDELGYGSDSVKSMRAIFIAAGPDIRPGSTLQPFDNVNVYPLVARILGLDAPKADGDVNILSKILK